jgi:outer membrane receptor protein involved in Fe transport
VSNGDGKLQWIAGLYYRDMSRFVTAGIVSIPPPPEGYPGIFDAQFDESFEQMAVFGELTYFFTDKFQATAGLRLFEEELTWKSATTGILATGPDIDDNQSLSKAAPKLILAHQPADHVTLYATYSQAFRSGGFNLSADYTFALGSALRGTIRASWNKIGNRYFPVGNEPISLMPSYELVNARIGVQSRSWQAYIYGTNIANEPAVLAWDAVFNRVYVQPMTIGVNFIWKLR